MVSYADLPGDMPGFTVYSFKNEYIVMVNKNLDPVSQDEFILKEINKIAAGSYAEEVVRCIAKAE